MNTSTLIAGNDLPLFFKNGRGLEEDHKLKKNVFFYNNFSKNLMHRSFIGISPIALISERII